MGGGGGGLSERSMSTCEGRLNFHTLLLGEMVMKLVIGEIMENFGEIFIISYFAKFTYEFTEFRITRKIPFLMSLCTVHLSTSCRRKVFCGNKALFVFCSSTTLQWPARGQALSR